MHTIALRQPQALAQPLTRAAEGGLFVRLTTVTDAATSTPARGRGSSLDHVHDVGAFLRVQHWCPGPARRYWWWGRHVATPV